MRTTSLVASLFRGIAALALSLSTIALLVVAPAQMQIGAGAEPALVTALNATVSQ